MMNVPEPGLIFVILLFTLNCVRTRMRKNCVRPPLVGVRFMGVSVLSGCPYYAGVSNGCP